MSAADSLPELRIFEREFERELLAMSRLRASLAVGFAAAALVLLSISFAVRADDFAAVMQRPHLRWWVLAAPALYVPFALALRRRLGEALAVGGGAPRWWSYAAATVEVSLPTIGGLVFIALTSARDGLQSPPFSMYPLLVVTWTLALDWRICLFAAGLATAEFLGVYAVYQPTLAAEAAGSLLSVAPPYIVRAATIAATGGIAALVAAQLRRRVAASLRAAQEHARVRQVFGQHVSPEVVEAILDRGGTGRPELREVCVLFLDVRGFTRFGESHPPAEVVAFLDRLLEPLLESVSRHGGVVNKLLGDGFMAVFGAPVPDPAAAACAIAAAREMLGIVARMVQEGAIPPTEIGIGVHHGSAITGNVGSPRRKEYTVIGDTVNLAARIEGLCKQFGARLLISEAAARAAGEGAAGAGECLGAVEIRGRSGAVTIYKLA